MATGSDDGAVHIFDGEISDSFVVLHHPAPIFAVSFSPNCKSIVAGGYDDKVYFWDTQTARLLGALDGHTGPVWALAFFNDNRHVVSGSYDHTIRIWDAKDLSAFSQPLRGHQSDVTSVAVSSSGRIISSSRDATIRVWEGVLPSQSGSSTQIQSKLGMIFLFLSGGCSLIFMICS
jgi:WD40 repeat protein